MLGRRFIGVVLAGSLAASLPAVTIAQEEPTTPEGLDWTLTRYLAADTIESVDVPFGISATLRLEDGLASGSGGCNAFNGTYQLVDDTLRFSDQLTRTLRLCDEDIQDVEDVYLSHLPDVRSWTITNGILELYDDVDDVLLTFEVADVVLTRGQLASLLEAITRLEEDIARVDERVDNVNVGRLRERIKTLEADTARLKQQIASAPKATPRPTTPPAGTGFNSAETVLLRGIPSRIASRCQPWRQLLPSGTVAAVRCTPNTTTTSQVHYYLMEAADAQGAFDTELALRSVPPANPPDGCANGTRSQQRFDFGPGFWVGEGCDRDPGPQVFVAFVDAATACKQLQVAGQRIRNPAYYITLMGNHNDIKRTYDWAKRGANQANTYLGIATPIPSNLKKSPACNV